MYHSQRLKIQAGGTHVETVEQPRKHLADLFGTVPRKRTQRPRKTFMHGLMHQGGQRKREVAWLRHECHKHPLTQPKTTLRHSHETDIDSHEPDLITVWTVGA